MQFKERGVRAENTLRVGCDAADGDRELQKAIESCERMRLDLITLAYDRERTFYV